MVWMRLPCRRLRLDSGSDTVILCATIEHSQHTVKASHSKASATNVAKSGTFSSATYLADLLVELDRAAICRRIAEARQRAGLTQPELAEALRQPVHWRTVQVWERGQRSRKGEHQWVVPWDRLDDIASVLGVTKVWLLHGDEPVVGGDDVNARLERLEQLALRALALLERDDQDREEQAQ